MRIRYGYERFDHCRVPPWAGDHAAASRVDDVDALQADDRVAGRNEGADAGKGPGLGARRGAPRIERKSCADQRGYERQNSKRDRRHERVKANTAAARCLAGLGAKGNAHDPMRRSIGRPTV